MEFSNERIQEMKVLLEKRSGKEVTMEETVDAARRLSGLVEIMYNMWIKDRKRQEKLKEYPKGSTLEGVGYTCSICRGSTHEYENWYDKYGIKCLICQKAIDRKIIPASLANHEESWYSKYDIESSFNIDRHMIQKWIKAGILKDRIIKNEEGRKHVQIFLIKDNKDFLPPKKLVKSQMVKETREGEDWFHCEPWYKFVEPHKHLKGYKIMNYLKVTYGGECKNKE